GAEHVGGRLSFQSSPPPQSGADARGLHLADSSAPRFAERTLWKICRERTDQSALTPANFTTSPHFSVSSAISLPKSAGDPASTVPPKSASRALTLGSARPALISLFSFSTISAGVLFGVPTPVQKLDS